MRWLTSSFLFVVLCLAAPLSKAYAGDRGHANQKFDLVCQGSERRLNFASTDSGDTSDESRNVRISLNYVRGVKSLRTAEN
jgi:hypothetical protein